MNAFDCYLNPLKAVYNGLFWPSFKGLEHYLISFGKSYGLFVSKRTSLTMTTEFTISALYRSHKSFLFILVISKQIHYLMMEEHSFRTVNGINSSGRNAFKRILIIVPQIFFSWVNFQRLLEHKSEIFHQVFANYR